MNLRKHVNCTDVAVEILKRFYVKQKDLWKLKVRWYRISEKYPPQDMKIEQRIKVPGPSIKDWVIYVYKPEERDGDQQADVSCRRRGHLEAEVPSPGEPEA